MAFNNEIRLQGNLTKDPEYKNISDKNLVTFRLAVNESIGKDKEETIYMDVDGWDNHAKYAENVMLAKGDRVIVTGRLKQREWTDGLCSRHRVPAQAEPSICCQCQR